jgi:hypothetical protein
MQSLLHRVVRATWLVGVGSFLAAGAAHGQAAAPRAHASVLLASGFSNNIEAPGAGAQVAMRLRQWSRARLEAEIGGVGFATVQEVCYASVGLCDNRQLSGAAWAGVGVVAGPGGGRRGRGVFVVGGAGPYSAWGIGCASAGRGCEAGIRTLGLQGSVGVGTRFGIGARTWVAGARVLTLERATGVRGVVTVLQIGPSF